MTVLGRVCLLGGRSGAPGTEVTFTLGAETAEGVRRMAQKKVSSGRNRCAHSMREALGWGLGDAHEWVRLPEVGFTRRGVAESARPGDIVVWPFTFGSRRSQHIGFAVGTGAGVRLLSNLSGNIEVSALAPGYCAFYKPAAGLPRPSPGPSPDVVPADAVAADTLPADDTLSAPL